MLNIHRLLLQRLTISWLLISVAVGGVVFYVGIEKIDDQLVDTAIAESFKISDANLAEINDPATDRAVLEHLARSYVRDNFVVVELYNRKREKVAERVNPNYAAIEEHLGQHSHPFPRDDDTHYERFTIGGHTVLQAIVPLKDSAGTAAGYLEGVFIVAQETLDNLYHNLVVTLLIALCTVLATTLVLYPVIVSLNSNVIRFTRDLLKGNVELMEVLGGAIAKRDSDTNIHNYRVAIYAVRLAEAARVDAGKIRDLIAGAFLHDVGKIGISDNILLKPDKLDEREFTAMKAHVALGMDILAKSSWLKTAREVVEFHHEKFDGSGYLLGIKGEDIPLNARIFAIVDVFDALTSQRPYKEALPFDQAMAILRRDSGSHFDPGLLAVFEDIAVPLYEEVSATADDAVEAVLREMIQRYFFAGSAA